MVKSQSSLTEGVVRNVGITSTRPTSLLPSTARSTSSSSSGPLNWSSGDDDVSDHDGDDGNTTINGAAGLSNGVQRRNGNTKAAHERGPVAEMLYSRWLDVSVVFSALRSVSMSTDWHGQGIKKSLLG